MYVYMYGHNGENKFILMIPPRRKKAILQATGMFQSSAFLHWIDNNHIRRHSGVITYINPSSCSPTVSTVISTRPTGLKADLWLGTAAEAAE